MKQEELPQKLQEALQALQTKDFRRAEVVFNQILKYNPKDSNALHLLGCLYKEIGDLTRAVELIQAAIREDGDNPIFFLNLGKILYISEKFQESSDMIGESLKRDSQSPEAWFCLGNALHKVNRNKQAIQAYQNALRICPEYPGVNLNLGHLLRISGNISGAKDCYLTEHNNHPSASICYALGSLLLEEKDYINAFQFAKTALSIENNIDYIYLCASICHKSQNYRNAIDYYKQALAIDSNHLNSSSSLGFAFFQAGLIDEAIHYYSSQLSIEFNHISSHFLFRAVDRRIPEKINREISIIQDFCSSAMRYLNINSILAFGDSHVNVFSDIDSIEVNYVGASTAYNLNNTGSSSGGAQNVIYRLERDYNNRYSTGVLLCFGEIDCRNHIIKQCYSKNTSLTEVVADVVTQYVMFIERLSSQGFRVIVYGCYGSGSHFNSVGRAVDRNRASIELTRQLSLICKKMSVPFFTIIDLMVKDSGLTKLNLLSDDVHLPETGIASNEIKSILMSRLMIACKDCCSDKSCSSFNNDWYNDYSNIAIVNIGECSQAILQWGHMGEIDLNPKGINSILLDLGCHCRLRGVCIMIHGLADEQISFLPTLFLDGNLIIIDEVIKEDYGFKFLIKTHIGRYLKICGLNVLPNTHLRIYQIVPQLINLQE